MMTVGGRRLAALVSLCSTIGFVDACYPPENPNSLLGCQDNPCTTIGSERSENATNPARAVWGELENELLNACAFCHGAVGPSDMPFLADPDPYQSIVAWPGMVTADPKQSKLLTYAMTGKGHSGKNLDAPSLANTLLPKIEAWLEEEAKNFTDAPKSVGLHLEPFVPILGFNAKYLDPLGTDFQGIAITFKAQMTAPTILELSEIQVHPTAKTGVRITHPIVVVHPIGRMPEPVDDLGDGEQTFDAGEFGNLGRGMVVLPNWPTDAKLSLAFEGITTYGATGSAGYGCKNVPAFEKYARPQVVVCLNCHGGANPNAVAAVDMTSLLNGFNPMAIQMACGQIRNRVNPASPPDSVLFITTNPAGNATHPYKFLGSIKTFESFRESVSKWIEVEQ